MALATSTIGAFLSKMWPVLVVAGGGLVAWGSLNSDVQHIKAQQDRAIDDHDRIVRIETQQQQTAQDIKDIKQDVKDIAKAVK